jgi:hypothetical protein
MRVNRRRIINCFWKLCYGSRGSARSLGRFDGCVLEMEHANDWEQLSSPSKSTSCFGTSTITTLGGLWDK